MQTKSDQKKTCRSCTLHEKQESRHALVSTSLSILIAREMAADISRCHAFPAK